MPAKRLEIQPILDQAFPDGIATIFAEFPATAAAASFGQVHRATTQDGQKVAVKVQYPYLEHTVAADIVTPLPGRG